MMMVWGTTIEMDPARTSSRGQIKRKMSKATLVCTFSLDKSVVQFDGLSRCSAALLGWSYHCCPGQMRVAVVIRPLLWS